MFENRVVVFDVSSSIALFRKPYTTTSSVSYMIPPPTTVAGLIAAVLGFDNGASEKGYFAKYWNKLKGCQIALRILNPVRWFRTAINLQNTKDPQKSPRIQVKHQFLKEPKYRIYFKGPISEKLEEHLKNQRYVFTPYLGVAYALANIEYIGTFEEKDVEEQETFVHSVVPKQDAYIDFSKTPYVHKDIFPFEMDAERTITKTVNVFYTTTPKLSIYITNGLDIGVKEIGNERIVWFDEW